MDFKMEGIKMNGIVSLCTGDVFTKKETEQIKKQSRNLIKKWREKHVY